MLVALAVAGAGATAAATDLAIDTESHTTVEQRVVPVKDRDTGFTNLKLGPGEPYMVRERTPGTAVAGRETRRRSLAYMSQMTDFQLADEESPARVEFADPGASSGHRPQEGLTPFQVEATIRQINHFTAASPVPQGDGTRNAMDFALITGDQADNQHLNETVWVRDLLEGNGPLNFNSGVTDPAAYADPTTLSPACNAFVLAAGGPEAAATEAARYTGVQDYDDYPVNAPPQPLYYDPDEPKGQFATWPDYGNLLDRAQQIEIDPVGLNVPFYITNGNHDVLVQGNEDANAAFEDIALGCFKALGSTIQPTAPVPDPDLLLTPLNVGMPVAPDPDRQFVDKLQIKEIYGATDEGPADDDHGFKYVDPEENEASAGSASYYAWDPEQTPGVRFISIDTNSEGGQTAEGVGPGSSNGNLDDPQFEWLRSELERAAARNQLAVIFGHHPFRSMSTQIRDEQAPPCTGEDDGHGHDLHPGCDRDPRLSDGDGCIHNGTDLQSNCPADEHESFVELIEQFPNVVAYVPGHTHEHRLMPVPRADGSTWWEINTSAVVDWPNQSRLIELMDNRDGTLSIFNTVVDHAAPSAAPAGCAPDSTTCGSAFTEPELASIGRTLTYNDHQNDLSGEGGVQHRNAELILGDPRPVSDLGVTLTDSPDPVIVGRPLTYTVTARNVGPAESQDSAVEVTLPAGVTYTSATPSQGTCTRTGRLVECELGTLAAAGTATVTIDVVPQATGEITATARVRGNVSDRQPANDAAAQKTTVIESPPAEETATATPSSEPTAAPSSEPTAGPGTTPTLTPTPGVSAKPSPHVIPRGRAACSARAFESVDVHPRGGRLRLAFELEPGAGPARIDVFQSSSGRRVVGERLVARFRNRTADFTWNGRANRPRRKVTDGFFFVRFRAVDARGFADVRRRVLRRSGGRWSRRMAFEKRVSCGLVSTFKLERPVFNGTTRRALGVAFRLSQGARVRIEILRGSRVVKRLRETTRGAGTTFRIRLDAGLRRREDYRVRLTAVRGSAREARVLVSRRL